MKHKSFVWRLLLVCLAFFASAGTASAQFNYFDITTATGRHAFAHNQVPDNLVPINAAITGTSYQWEQSSLPLDGFTNISGATGATYSFSAPLTQTTYFRRKFILNAGFINIVGYSNVLKIDVVSVNWENLNYIREHDVLISGVTTWQGVDNLPIGDKLQTTTYLDGMGRPVQVVSKETATPSAGQPNLWGDIVSFNKYDAYGRESKQYLSYTTTLDAGKYKTTALTDQSQYYTNVYNESVSYDELTFANNPLERVSNRKSAGTAWAAGSGVSVVYELNDANDDVQIFTIGYTTGAVPARVGAYSAKTLYKTISTDEHGKQTIEYTDKHGHLILSKVQNDDNPGAAHTGWICTYSIYDDFGMLRYTIQPEGVNYLAQNSWSFTGTNAQKVLDEWCYRYEYDADGRTVRKKAPGAKELLFLYDKRDRVVFTQDGNQRTHSPAEWTASLYDELDRPILTTLYHTTKTVAALQSDIDNAVTYTNFNVTNPAAPLLHLTLNFRDPSVSQYLAQKTIEFVGDNGGFESGAGDEFTAEISPGAVSPGVTIPVAAYLNPISPTTFNNSTTTIKYFFYDNYSYYTVKNFSFNFNNTQAYNNGDPILPTERTVSFLTGTMTRVLGTNTFLTSSIYYDDRGRAIQTLEDNIKSGVDITTAQYKFDDRLLSSSTYHSAPGTEYAAYGILNKYLFDKIGRVTGIEKKFASNAFKRIAEYTYDDVGRLKTKRLAPGYTGTGKSELETLTYSYNLNSDLTGINKDYALKTPGVYSKWGNFFGLYLGYDNRDNVFANANLRGQITGALWNTQGDDAQRKYDFVYDHSGRLTNANFNEKEKPADAWSNAKVDFSVSGRNGKIEYDLNGNLLYMLQKGVIPGNATPVAVDDLQYSYYDFSNRLKKVVDANVTTTNGKLDDFSDGSNGSNDDYVYDDNGNLVIDLNKNAKELNNTPGANGIRYNHLDKPEEIRIAGKGTINIVYDADGVRLQKKYTPENSSTTTITTYINEFVYKGDDLQYINTEEGRLRVMQTISQSNGYDVLNIDGNIDMPGSKRGAYDYFIRDYLGNVRMILTEETHSGGNAATMETQRAANEEPVFGQVDANGNPTSANEVAARFAVANIPGQSSNNGWQNSNIGNHVSRIGNLAGSKIGPNALLKVMAGDQVSATTIYYYQNPVTNSSGGATLVTDLLVALTQTIAGSPVTSGLQKGAASSITAPFSNSAAFTSIADPDAADPTGDKPKAYLSVLFFDERFNFVGEGSVSLRVQQSGNGAPALVLANIKAPKNGYAYVYVANESDEMVYFDNLQVSHVRGRIIEENHYYAFGLKIAGISSKKMADPGEGHIDNKNLYNDKELIDDADLDWYDYGYRNYDPQIGRFVQIDPLTDIFYWQSPYVYADNDPIGNIDYLGLGAVPGAGGWVEDVFHNTLGAVTVTAKIPAKTAATISASLVGSLFSAAFKIAASSPYWEGFGDEMANANTLGGSDFMSKVGEKFWGGKYNWDKYADDPEKQRQYLEGRIAGSYAALLQSGLQMKIGGGLAALPTGGTQFVGGVLYLHGAGVGARALMDLARAKVALAQLQQIYSGTPQPARVQNFSTLDRGSESGGGRGGSGSGGGGGTSGGGHRGKPEIGRKLDYVFGKATGSKHNIDRSTGMKRQLESIGIFDTPANRDLLKKHLESVYEISRGLLQKNGRRLRESLFMGPNGGIKIESIWEGNKLITIKLIGGKT
jgi:RHS repeat-associated protein